MEVDDITIGALALAVSDISEPLSATTPTSNTSCGFNSLPDELVLSIFGYVSPWIPDNHNYADRLSVLRVSRRFRSLMLDKKPWSSDYTQPVQWNYHFSTDVRFPGPGGPRPGLQRTLLCEVKEALMLLHAAWPDPTSPPPALRLTVMVTSKDVAILARAAALGFALPHYGRLGQVVEYVRFGGAWEDPNNILAMWSMFAGPAVRFLRMGVCALPATVPLPCENFPNLVDFRSDAVVPRAVGMHLIYGANQHVERVDTAFFVGPPGMRRAMNEVSRVRRLFLRMPMPVPALGFPQLEFLTTGCSSPTELGWDSSLPPLLTSVVFFYSGNFPDWCCSFFETMTQLRELVVFGPVEQHGDSDLCDASVPKPGLEFEHTTTRNFQGRGFDVTIRRHDAALQPLLAYRLSRSML